ncbi:hypothetical protein PIB30_007611 [Stylosanthes scabra]|uniref:Uncharacterized protein n=1 Tax=Stylosanthes scabra TaxID=79078 RepID=A0ABU6V4D8_9FABA|nr:hypothetical protein [Stylosanthes scabra]
MTDRGDAVNTTSTQSLIAAGKASTVAMKKLDGGREPQSNGHKRSRSDGASPDRPISEEKRVRVGDSAASDVDAVSNDDDEDWLRYSPPPKGEEEVMFVKEKEPSRYASEIDGE